VGETKLRVRGSCNASNGPGGDAKKGSEEKRFGLQEKAATVSGRHLGKKGLLPVGGGPVVVGAKRSKLAKVRGTL